MLRTVYAFFAEDALTPQDLVNFQVFLDGLECIAGHAVLEQVHRFFENLGLVLRL